MRGVSSRLAFAFVIATAGVFFVQSARADDDQQLRRLLDRVATGDEVESAAAADELVERVLGPLTRCVESMDARPLEQQVRLHELLLRLNAELRLRVVALDLTPEDRRLLEQFKQAYPQLVLRLFGENFVDRVEAVQQIPLTPNSGAGVLIASKVNDPDEDVAQAALDVAAKLHDSVVARNLTRYVADVTKALRGGFYGPEQRDLAITVGQFAWRSIEVIDKAAARESAPVVADALDYFARSKLWDALHRVDVIHTLATLGDRAVAPILVQFLPDEEPVAWDKDPRGKPIPQTVGDAALWSLVRLFALDPTRFGLYVPDPEKDFAGFADADARDAGHRAFRKWYKEHAASQPASQPSQDPPDKNR